MVTNYLDDLVGSYIFLGEFLGRPECADELSLNVGVVPNLEVRSRSTASVSGDLITLLSFSDVSPEFLVKFVQINGKLSSTSRSEVSFRVDSDVRMITFVGEERGNTGGSGGSIVVGKLREGQEL